MKNQVYRGGMGLILAASAACFTGCVCPQKSAVCVENESRGYATISCQPMDTAVGQGQKAEFTVEATGKNLTYQWFFKGTSSDGDVVDPTLTTGGQTWKLTVPAVDSTKGGIYWCEIESVTSLGQPTLTRTRDARLSTLVGSGGGGGGGSIQVFLPQPAYAPAKKNGSSSCGSHCSWVNYQNGGAGYNPDPGTTLGHAKVRIGTGAFLPQAAFHLKWFDSAGGSGCAMNSASPNTDRKEFPIDHNKIYFFTVYLTSAAPCPAAGTTVFLDLLTFQ